MKLLAFAFPSLKMYNKSLLTGSVVVIVVVF